MLTKTLLLTFSFIIIIKCGGNNRTCGSYQAKDSSSCFSYTNNTDFCCYLTTYSEGQYNSLCYPIARTAYLALDNKLMLGGYQYSVDCGQFVGTTCGTINTPMSYQDCAQFSVSTNSCCYYTYNGDSSCVWLGSPFIGTLDYKGLVLICSAAFYHVGYIFYLIIISLVLL